MTDPVHGSRPGHGEAHQPLPGHIAALLERQNRDDAGRVADSAGIAWEGRDLSGEGNPLHTFDGDDGLAPAVLDAARQAVLAGTLGESGFVSALAGQRLFVPVLAGAAQSPDQDLSQHGDKQSDITLVSMTARDGRQALPAFSSVEALTHWHPKARPVAAEAERVMLAALAEGAELVVLDPGASLPFVIRRPAVEAIARGDRWTASYEDSGLAEELADAVTQCPGVVGLVLSPGEGVASVTAEGEVIAAGGSGPELRVVAEFESGLDPVDRRLALRSLEVVLGENEVLRRRADSVQILGADAQ